MNECKPTEKSNFENTDLSSISNILSMISSVFNIMDKPAEQIPPPLLLIGKNLRPGMSARNLAGRTISRVDSEANIPMGDVFLDGQNNQAKQIRIESEEIVDMIQTKAKVEIIIDPGAIQVTSTGSAGPIPVVTQGSNIKFVSGGGGIQ